MQITFVFGASALTINDVASGSTIASVLPSIRARLGLPESVDVRIDGVTVQTNTTLRDGDEVVFEKKAASKA